VREGYWISIKSGQAELVQEHCDFMKDHARAQKIGLPENVYEQIKDIPNDYSGPRRERILRLVMAAGFIRVRGHGDWIAIEFTAPTNEAMIACSSLLRQVCGPLTVLRLNNLSTDESLEMAFQEFESRVK
jgi:hypothetical protein